MEEIKIDEIMDVIEFKDKPLSQSDKREENGTEEKIRIYVPPKGTKSKSYYLRFIIMTVVFFFLFLCVAMLIKDRQADIGADTEGTQQAVMSPDTGTQEELTVIIRENALPVLVIDESKIGADIKVNEDYSLHPLIKASEGIKVLIVHSHNSEYVSETLSVSDAGDAISQLFSSAGIETYHCVVKHDADGIIGSYSRMKESLASLIEKYPDTVCVIDIHDSDSGLPVTFTVGTDGIGWNENLRLAEAVCGRMRRIESAFRFLPGTMGQDSGILTLNVGIGGKDCGEAETRAVIAAFAEAFIEICNEKASAP